MEIKKLIRVTIDKDDYEFAKKVARGDKVFFNKWVAQAIAEKARRKGK
jgi:predicted HicB family RNase H-like nuclease